MRLRFEGSTHKVSGNHHLHVIFLPQGGTYYKLEAIVQERLKTLLECDVYANGRRIDYLALDEFYGHVARPLP